MSKIYIVSEITARRDGAINEIRYPFSSVKKRREFVKNWNQYLSNMKFYERIGINAYESEQFNKTIILKLRMVELDKISTIDWAKAVKWKHIIE